MGKFNYVNLLIVVAVLAVIGLLYMGFTGMLGYQATIGGSTPAPSSAGNVPVATQCNVVPTYTYSAVDAIGTSGSISGTDEIKLGNGYPATSLASPTFGEKLTYWKLNASHSGWYVEPVTVPQVFCGANRVQAKAYNNASVTVKIYDTDNAQFLTNSASGAKNFTIGANGVSNSYIQYQGTAKKASMPFGGCIAIEVPTTITDISLNGLGVSSSVPCPYVWTYTTTSTSNTYKLFAVPAGWDASGLGDLKKIDMQLKAGSSDPDGIGYISFAPANYYIGNDGNFYLGIEKDKNADTTKTGHMTGYQHVFGIN